MKKIYLIIISTLIFTNCEEVINVNTPSSNPKLVIDAFFEVFFTKQPITAKTTIKLSLSADYFTQNNPPVKNATVFITDLSDNNIINFKDINKIGTYIPEINFIPKYDVDYKLTIIYNGETFTSIGKRIRTSPLISVTQGDKTLFSGDETQVKVVFKDDVSREDYYRFNFDKNFYLPLEDRFINGSEYPFSFFFQEDEIVLPTTITVKISGITKDYFTYFRTLLAQSGQNGGGPFQTIPSTLLGNIVNITNKKNFALGYFIISDTDTAPLKLQKKAKAPM